MAGIDRFQALTHLSFGGVYRPGRIGGERRVPEATLLKIASLRRLQ